MALTRRGRRMASILTIVLIVGAAVFGLSALAGRGKPSQATGTPGSTSPVPTTPPPPPRCPLTGVKSGAVPNRSALAVKVENIPEARPQTGLSWADVVYEEPVEGGITRFIAVYQCSNASRIEPIRSARLTDPDVLVQFGHPLFAYAGGVAKVEARVRQRGLVDINYSIPAAAGAYHRDSNRFAPHNLYSSTKELYALAHTPGRPPEPAFIYAAKPPATAVPAASVHLPFSGYSDVFWKWSAARKAWLRFHGSKPHLLSDGTQVSATNVVVQVVKVVLTDITDANGVASPEVISIGSGKAVIFRNGKAISGTWSRPALSDLTKFMDAQGKEIPLAVGNTWVELLPQTIPFTFA